MRLFLFLLLVVGSASAAPVDHVPVPEDESVSPQVNIAAVGIGTLDGGRTGDQTKPEPGVNFSDSSLFVGGAQRLYDGSSVGALGLGILTTEETTSGNGAGISPFLHQAYVAYQTQHWDAFAGRTDNPTAHLIDFPTIRGDDLITLLNPLNPYSNGNNREEHRYSNTAAVIFNQDLKLFENVHAQHLINSAGIGTQSGINSFGINVQYLGTPGMEVFEKIPFWGLGYEHMTLNAQSPGGLNEIYAGGILNLNQSVTQRFDLRVQDILSWGSDLSSFQTNTDTFQASSNSLAASIRYLRSPFGKPGDQIALTGAYKTYFNVRDARSLGFAITGASRLGQGFDFVAQYLGQWREPALAAAQSSGVAYEQVAEIGFVFNFSATFNQYITPRRSLLNQKHQYLPD